MTKMERAGREEGKGGREGDGEGGWNTVRGGEGRGK